VRQGTSFEFDVDELLALGLERASEYQRRAPFPHVVIDDFLPEWACDAVLAEWPAFEDITWTTYSNEQELKHVCSDLDQLGSATRGLLAAFNSSQFVRFLQVLTGITPLLVDPHYRSSGIFDVPPGGFLDLHADFTQCPLLFPESETIPRYWDGYAGGSGVHRRVNALLYLNRDWRREHGGALEFWSNSPFEQVQSILPAYNRLVVFTTLPDAVHGHPQPVVEPPGGSRRCLSAYYYTKERPLRELVKGRHSVTFGIDGQVPGRGERTGNMSELLMPPIVRRAMRRVRRKFERS
jgi:hypothetical protein